MWSFKSQTEVWNYPMLPREVWIFYGIFWIISPSSGNFRVTLKILVLLEIQIHSFLFLCFPLCEADSVTTNSIPKKNPVEQKKVTKPSISIFWGVLAALVRSAYRPANSASQKQHRICTGTFPMHYSKKNFWWTTILNTYITQFTILTI